MHRIIWAGALLLALGLQSCEGPFPQADDGKLKVVCTTGMIGNAVEQIAGDLVEVHSLMGPGVDPHLYKASQGDLKLLGQADLIFYNGLHLEGKMGEILEKVGRTKRVVAVSDGVDHRNLLSLDDKADAYDPHIWFDVRMWADAAAHIGTHLAASDSLHAERYLSGTEAYLDSLKQLDGWVRTQIAGIPEAQRVLITAHDAFSYFGRAYGMEVRGLQGISTVSEYGLKDVKELVDFISERQIPAVFVESSVPTKSLEAVAEGCRQRGHEVHIGGTLFSDAMGPEGTPEGSYLGMVRANVRTIVEELKPGLKNGNEHENSH